MLIPLAKRDVGRNSDTNDMANGPEHPMPMPWNRRTATSAGKASTTPYSTSEMQMIACAHNSRRLREKLSNAGPANGRMSSAVTANELTVTPTKAVLAPKWSANTGMVVFAMNAAMLWKKFTTMRTTYGTLQMVSRLSCPFAAAS